MRMVDILKGGVSFVSNIVESAMLPPIAKGAGMIVENIENKMIKMEKRILRKIYFVLITGFGGIFLIFAFFPLPYRTFKLD